MTTALCRREMCINIKIYTAGSLSSFRILCCHYKTDHFYFESLTVIKLREGKERLVPEFLKTGQKGVNMAFRQESK